MSRLSECSTPRASEVLGKEQSILPVEPVCVPLHLLAQEVFLEQLLAQAR